MFNRFSPTKIGATKAALARRQLDEPIAAGRLRFAHRSLLAGASILTGSWAVEKAFRGLDYPLCFALQLLGKQSRPRIH
jgi:hypothetical protein